MNKIKVFIWLSILTHRFFPLKAQKLVKGNYQLVELDFIHKQLTPWLWESCNSNGKID
jgi:hypothetical protein